MPAPTLDAPNPAAPQITPPAAPAAPAPRQPDLSGRPPTYTPTKQSSNPFEDLDSLGEKSPAPAPAPAATPKTPGKPSEPSTPSSASGAPKPDDKSKSKPTGETKVDHPIDPKPDDFTPEPGEKFRTSKELRQAYVTRGSELEAAKKRLVELEERQKQLEASPGDTAKAEERIAQAIADKEKRITELESKFEAVAFEQSEKFMNQYEKPFHAEVKRAYEEVSQLIVTLEDGTQRPGTKDDFEMLRRMPKGLAYQKAHEMFGHAGGDVMSLRNGIEKIVRDSQQAIQDHNANREVRQREEAATKAKEREAAGQMWTKANADISAKYEWFRPTEDTDPNHDPEENKLLTEGFNRVDTFFHNRATLTPQERVILDARIRNEAAAFPRMVHRNKKLAARVADLETKLKEFEDSGPGPGDRDGAPANVDAKPKTWQEDFDKRVPG